MSQAPTLINLPPPPSDPVTPSDAPGTPNSTTTSMSELSTVAIKDGHRGHLPHHQHPLEAERADRISRLAGLERVATARQATINAQQTGFAAPQGGGPPAYFDSNAQPVLQRERSTVGSASATGSVGGRTTWASGSDVYDATDRMSEDQDAEMATETSSVGGFSDEGTPSLVAFGESGARTPARYSTLGSPVVGNKGLAGSFTGREAQQMQDARMIDGRTHDAGVVDTSHQTPPLAGGADGAAARSGLSGTEAAERILRDRIERGVDVGQGNAMVGTEEPKDGAPGVGKFYFEGK